MVPTIGLRYIWSTLDSLFIREEIKINEDIIFNMIIVSSYIYSFYIYIYINSLYIIIEYTKEMVFY